MPSCVRDALLRASCFLRDTELLNRTGSVEVLRPEEHVDIVRCTSLQGTQLLLEKRNPYLLPALKTVKTMHVFATFTEIFCYSLHSHQTCLDHVCRADVHRLVGP